MNRKRLRNTLLITAAVLAVYFILLSLLLWAEKGNGSSINTLEDAVWYSIVTLTTVGYGDVAPVTTVGHIIGIIFLLLSTGILVTLLGTAVSFLTGEALPLFRLHLLRKKNWYYFADLGPESNTLASGVYREDPDAVIIFGISRSSVDERPDYPCIFVNQSPSRIVGQKHGAGTPCKVFLMKENDIGVNLRAVNLGLLPVEVYARTESGQDSLPGDIHFFHSYDCCAREYWRNHPLCPHEKHIVLIGFGRYGRALLERAILTNVHSAENPTAYHVFGKAGPFPEVHQGLDMVFSIGEESSERDSILFHGEGWSGAREILEKADRIIICRDDEEAGWDDYWTLLRYYVLKGRIDLRSNRPVSGVSHFGTNEEIYTPENILHTNLNRVAIAMNDLYRSGNPGAKAWNELDDSLRESKIAAADHLLMKVRFLLKDESITNLDADLLRRAFDAYRAAAADPEQLERCRRIEHLRWLRFYTYYNWQYGESHDPDRRLDPRILPYVRLTPLQKSYCDYSWELLGQLTLDRTEKS